jgi:hypothetical protein
MRTRRAATLLCVFALGIAATLAAAPDARGQSADDEDLPLDPIARALAIDQRLA